MPIEMYIYNALLSVSLMTLYFTFENKYPEIFDNNDNKRIHIMISENDKVQAFLFLMPIVFILFAPIINFMFALCYASLIIWYVVRSKSNKG